MISQIEIKNFKSLKKVSVKTKNLNVLMGLNGMGKSSFIQMLLLLMQSDKLEERVIDLNGILVQIGQGRDALYQYAEEDNIEFGLNFGYDTVENIFTKYLEKNNQRKTPERFAILKEIYSTDDTFDIDTLYDRMKTKNHRVSPATLYNTIELLLNCNLVIKNQSKDNREQYEKAKYPVFNWKFLYQKDKDKLTAEFGYRKTAMEFFRSQTKKFQYISAERIGPQDLYEASSIIVSDKKQLGLLGEYAAYFINVFGSEYNVKEELRHPKATSEKLNAQLNAWLSEIISPGVSLNTKYIPEVNKVILDYQFDLGNSKTNSFRPKNVGFGISYVLPIVLVLLTAEENKIIVIENPESHIHPRGQAELGKLISLAAQTGAQLFIETHSDHILNGIRVAVKENSIDKSDVNIMYFDKVTTDKEQYSSVKHIEIDNNGELSEYPKDFLDEWSNQLLKLI
ncbi:MAG: DUF3696 domain-containing protein [Bacteroidales bacterium]|nr:DUF3696 domain-containing protein [Bacteroidales bacterium]